MNKHKRLKKKLRALEKRIAILESDAKATLWNYPDRLTFPQFAKKVESEISRLRSRVDKDG
ncbi:MAG: hypothetical protein OSJ43_14940 [Oscillospiraceae bacterium]|nr:hypothetical protein [Oscillospiraceae bacterium]